MSRGLWLLVLTLTACGSGGSGSTLTVLAAASLTDSFTQIGEAYEAAQPGTQVSFSFAGSQTIVRQVLDGAPVDVVAAADWESLQPLLDASLASGSPVPFASNRLVLAVAPGNPAGIRGLADLTREELVIVLPAPEVPAGRYAVDVLAHAGIEPSVDSFEADVRAALSKVRMGEADGAIVYASDVSSAEGEVAAIPLPAPSSVAISYPIMAISASADAEAFVELVLSDVGFQILRRHGFDGP